MTEWLLSAYDDDKLLKAIALFLAWIAQPIQHFGNVAWSVEKPMPSGSSQTVWPRSSAAGLLPQLCAARGGGPCCARHTSLSVVVRGFCKASFPVNVVLPRSPAMNRFLSHLQLI